MVPTVVDKLFAACQHLRVDLAIVVPAGVGNEEPMAEGHVSLPPQPLLLFRDNRPGNFLHGGNRVQETVPGRQAAARDLRNLRGRR